MKGKSYARYFNEELKAVADDLDRMVHSVRKAINGAGDALLNQNLEAAQAVIDGDIEIDAWNPASSTSV